MHHFPFGAIKLPIHFVGRLQFIRFWHIGVAVSGVALVLAATALPTHAQAPQELIRGVEGLSPALYYEIAEEARRLYQREIYTGLLETQLRYAPEEAAAAERTYGQLTAAYPWNSEHWFWLGYVRFQRQSYAAAAEAFERAHKLGIPAYAREMPSFIARAYALSGQYDRAVEWLEKALEEYHFELPSRLLRDSAFVGLRDDTRFRALAPPEVDSAASRVEGWRTDLDYLLSQVQLLNPVYSEQPLPDSMVQAAKELRERIPTLTDPQVAVGMQRLLTMLGQSHNTFFYPYNSPEENARVVFSRLPLEFYLFPDGLYVTAASALHEALIGARVLRFDDSPAVQTLGATRVMNDRENEVEVAQATTFLTMPQVLHALGLTRSPEYVNLTVQDRDGRERSVRIDATPYAESRRLSTGDGPSDSAALPMSLRETGGPFWFEPTPEGRAVYVQFNAVISPPRESLSQFAIRLREHISAHPEVRNLIVDMRRNNGGNSYVYTELLRTLIDFDVEQRNRLFVIIGRRTYSAAQNFITDVDRLTNAIFVGEPSGGKPNTIGGDLAVVDLPYSNLRVGLASASWVLSGPRDRRLWIAPDVPVATTAEEYFGQQDPVLETVLRMAGS